jgi:hypothetical protein
MKEQILYHGIPIVGRMPLFTFGNRQAVRDDRKGQTRRVMKEQPSCNLEGAYFDAYDGGPQWNWWLPDGRMCNGHDVIRCPYGIPGDVRCMCEPLKRGRDGLAPGGLAYYRDDRELVISLITGKPIPWRWKRDYLASIHMPTEAARTICRITDIRVEKLQEISDEDAETEGIQWCRNEFGVYQWKIPGDKDGWFDYANDAFGYLWDSINKAKGYGWDVPQWVFVNTFEKLEV